MFMCPLKIKFISIPTLTFKDKESGKMSAGGACVWKVSKGELTNPPVLSSLFSLNIDAEYVFIFKYNYYFEYYIVDGHFFFFFFCVFSLNQVFYTCNICKLIFLFFLYNSSMGTNQHESYFATSYHDDNASQLYQHTFKERMGKNWHESYIRPILSLHFYFQRFQS